MTKKPPFTDPRESSDDAPDLSRIYRGARQDVPPSRLDDRVLAEARHPPVPPKQSRRAFNFWVAPVSLAAVLVLSVTLVLFLSKEGVEPTRTAPAAVPAAKKAQSPGISSLPDSPVPPERAALRPPSAPSENSDRAAKAPPMNETAGSMTPSATSQPQNAETVQRAPALARSDLSSRALAPHQSLETLFADVVAVAAQGNPGAYQFDVTIKSPDTGCGQYADWWEVVGLDGTLLYRRVLDHSHVNEQPFLRSGGPVPLQADTIVWVRAHMHALGYGGTAFKGSVATGFSKTPLSQGFAASLSATSPLPTGCDF